MSVTMSVAGKEAVIDGYVWASDDELLEQFLNSMLDPGGPSGADPNPDLNAAIDAAGKLGGKVIDRGLPVVFVEGRVY